ncbi:MAG: hypothetical protein QXJ07_06325 [Candidatus Bathyarchaeia archaeon]
MRVLEQVKFSEPYQYRTVEAGRSGVVWFMPVTGGYVAFISQVYICWFPNCWLEFIVDGVPVEPRIEHAIGSLTAPKTYDPPIVARKAVKVVAHNNDSVAHTFECLIDGVLARPV